MSEISDQIEKPKMTTLFWIIVVIAVLWNLAGFVQFIGYMMIGEEELSALNEAQRELFETNPMWMKAMFGIATLGGLVGSIGLIMRKNWAVTALLVSLIAIVIQMGYSTIVQKSHEIMESSLALPIIVVVFAGLLLYYAKSLAAKGILK